MVEVLILRGFRLELGYIWNFHGRIIPEASARDNLQFVRYAKGS